MERLRERSREGRKETGRELSKRNWKRSIGNEAKRKGRDLRDERTEGAPEEPAVRRDREESGKEEAGG